MSDLNAASVDAIARIDAVPLILDVACRMTGMGFAAVARVTEAHGGTLAVESDAVETRFTFAMPVAAVRAEAAEALA